MVTAQSQPSCFLFKNCKCVKEYCILEILHPQVCFYDIVFITFILKRNYALIFCCSPIISDLKILESVFPSLERHSQSTQFFSFFSHYFPLLLSLHSYIFFEIHWEHLHRFSMDYNRFTDLGTLLIINLLGRQPSPCQSSIICSNLR